MTNLNNKLAARLLRLAADEFSNHSCSDFDISDLTPAERLELSEGCWRQNGAHEDERQYISDAPVSTDWVLMHYIADQLDLEE